MIPAGPVTLALGAGVSLDPPEVAVDQVVLTNLSPYMCAVDIGGPQDWLRPWTAQLYAVPSGQSVSVLPKAEISGGGSDNGLWVSWVLAGESVAPASYPQSLTAEAVVASLSPGSNLGVTNVAGTSLLQTPDQALALNQNFAISGGASVSLGFKPRPTDRSGVLLVVTTAGTSGLANVTGDTSGAYWAQDIHVGQTPSVFPLYGVIDPSAHLVLQANDNVAWSGTAWVVTCPDEIILGSEPATAPMWVAAQANLPVTATPSGDPATADTFDSVAVTVANTDTVIVPGPALGPQGQTVWNVISKFSVENNATTAGACFPKDGAGGTVLDRIDLAVGPGAGASASPPFRAALMNALVANCTVVPMHISVGYRALYGY